MKTEISMPDTESKTPGLDSINILAKPPQMAYASYDLNVMIRSRTLLAGLMSTKLYRKKVNRLEPSFPKWVFRQTANSPWAASRVRELDDCGALIVESRV